MCLGEIIVLNDVLGRCPQYRVRVLSRNTYMQGHSYKANVWWFYPPADYLS